MTRMTKIWLAQSLHTLIIITQYDDNDHLMQRPLPLDAMPIITSCNDYKH